MTRPVLRLRAVASVGALAVVAAGLPLGATAASASTSLTRTAYSVSSYCSQAGGLQQNLVRPVSVLRLTVSPASPRAGKPVRVKVFVDQPQSTPPGQIYPRGFLRGEVVVGVGPKNHTLVGPRNRTAVSGPVFPGGWTAKTSFSAPAKGKYKVKIKKIAYNVLGGGRAGGWSKPYTGFDLVCSGGLDPVLRTTAYPQPRLTLKVRRPA